MKKGIFAVGLALCLTLSGCEALLERSYSSSTPHADRPTTAEDPSVLRVENYRELVSAVLYLVSQGAEEGTIQLHDYAGSVENDLTAACAEVATEDPLGAYVVDYIKHEYTRVVSYYQATLNVHYRRSQEEVRSMVKVTGTGAIRAELQEALARFDSQVVLRVAYFSEDEQSIAQLIRQAYYDTPASALGLPEAEIFLYPDSGRERVVEILLTYPEPPEELRQKGEVLTEKGKELALPAETLPASADLSSEEKRAQTLLSALWAQAAYSPNGGATAYDALVTGAADDEGMALAYTFLAGQQGLPCRVIEGTWNGAPRFWNTMDLSGETFYLDPSERGGRPSTAQEFFEAGYRWEGGPEELAAEEQKERQTGPESE